MAMTKSAWSTIKEYDVYISNIVMDELHLATPDLINRFDEIVKGFHVLESTKEAENLANIYVEQGIIPERYYDDALHVAIASTNDIGLLISWNFKHLVKIKTRKLVAAVNTLNDYLIVEIISPPEL